DYYCQVWHSRTDDYIF
nr:immunoglobulin light chain junction region [Macaca mulatta]MOX12276.1 immunoglobulin light chain junction region [Macaca mulatta]MOX12622.1 immunoglobulin light chain junction region [Macaca mulatta]MOX12942.1 immunoglobulin light chain junction region [Macaca mulatta]MOX12981.1 immunoglobulin light chain junction region [Macaca mulatta]